MFKNLNTQIFIGIILGVAAGLLLQDRAIMFDPIGDMFIRLLKMVIIPLIVTSIIMGVVSLGDVQHLGQMGGRTGIYFLCTTAFSTGLGVVLAFFLRPGIGSSLQVPDPVRSLADKGSTSIMSLISEVIPSNVVEAMANSNVLPVIFFSLIVGVALISIGQKGAPFIQIVSSFNEAILKIVDWIMLVAPVGVFALIASLVGRLGIGAFEPLAYYIILVLSGLAIHAGVFLMILLMVLGRFSPITLIRGLSPALAMAFSTASSIATLPITMECLKKRLKQPGRIVNFVCPLGATINMDGTGLYQAVATLFIAQVYGIELSISQFGVVVATATLASIGAAAVPSAGLITMAIILKAVGVPLEGIGLILAVDRILDMFRTSVNVLSDSVGTIIISSMEKKSAPDSPSISPQVAPIT